ncbi:MAG: tetratricopeptide repeat protein [Alphaproteobacteria bacterium]|nr:MAG: tetratricopeptide repeat protein [Alphaproteobacteria bacterium]
MARARALQAEGAVTGWIVMAVLTLLTGGGLAIFVRGDKGALQFTAAALLLALAGYAWQGHPGFAGAPRVAPGRISLPDSEFAKTRGDMLGRFDQASAWLNMADSFQRRGDTQTAAELLQGAVRRTPDNPDLWVGYGNALLLHGGGIMNPAAELAFERAAALAPGHPAPRFFYGLALAQSGDYAAAERIWREIVAEAPPGAEYRAVVEERLRAIEQARAAGQIPR